MRMESIDEICALDVSAFDVPAWARWVAANGSGAVWAYREKPTPDKHSKWWLRMHVQMGDVVYLCTIDMTGIDWRRTLTPVNIGLHATAARRASLNLSISSSVHSQPPQPWCERCGLLEDICRGHDDAIPGDVAETLFAQHSASWCQRLIDELLTLLEAAKDSERHASLEAATFTPDTDCYFALSSAGAVE